MTIKEKLHIFDEVNNRNNMRCEEQSLRDKAEKHMRDRLAYFYALQVPPEKEYIRQKYINDYEDHLARGV